MANSKLSAFFSLLLVFISGIVVGGIGYRAYSAGKVSPRPQEKQDPEVRRKQLIDEMTKECKLDPDQVAKLSHIYDETREHFFQLHKDMDEKSHAAWDQQIVQIRLILRPEQIPLYDALRARHEAERAARHKGEIKKGQ
jgi:hypothetical protein